MLDCMDPAIRAFTRTALDGAGPDRFVRAERLRGAVSRHIREKTLASTFDTASEVIRSRRGDCTEHAVLLAAALRADGIPSRVAMGLVHVSPDGRASRRFEWHMWSQAMIDGLWHDFDPTRSRRFDAGHLLFATSPLCDGCQPGPSELLLGLVGRVEVEPIMIDGRRPGREGDPS